MSIRGIDGGPLPRDLVGGGAVVVPVAGLGDEVLAPSHRKRRRRYPCQRKRPLRREGGGDARRRMV
eukprot:5682566-Alexandrium_andersonii.AAC.1